MSFRGNAEAIILMKSAGTNPDLWYATIDGKSGFVSNRFLRETRVFVKDPPLIVPVDVRNERSQEVQPDRVQQSHEVVEGTTIYSGEATSENSQYDSTTLPPEALNDQSTPLIFKPDYVDDLSNQSPENTSAMDDNSSQQLTESSSFPTDYDYAQPTTDSPINTTPQLNSADYADALGPDQSAPNIPENKISNEQLNARRSDQDVLTTEPLTTPQSIASGEASTAAQVPENIDLLPQTFTPDSIENVDYNIDNNVSKDTLNIAEQQNLEYKDSYDNQQPKQVKEPDYADALSDDYGQNYRRVAENGQVQEPTIQTIPALQPKDASLASAEVKDPPAVTEPTTQATYDETTPVIPAEFSSQEQTQDIILTSIPPTPAYNSFESVEGNHVTPAPEILPPASREENQEQQNPNLGQPTEYTDVISTTPAVNMLEDYIVDSTLTPKESAESVSETMSTDITEESTTTGYDQVTDYDSFTTEATTTDDYRKNTDDGINDASYLREDDEEHSLFSNIFTTLSSLWSTDAPPSKEENTADVDQTENKVDVQSWYSFVSYLTNAFNSQEETKALFASPGKCLLLIYDFSLNKLLISVDFHSNSGNTE